MTMASGSQFASMVPSQKTGAGRLTQEGALGRRIPFVYGFFETIPAQGMLDFSGWREKKLGGKKPYGAIQCASRRSNQRRRSGNLEIAGELQKVPWTTGITATVAAAVYISSGYLWKTGLVTVWIAEWIYNPLFFFAEAQTDGRGTDQTIEDNWEIERDRCRLR